jgi:hypothetical protein
MVVKRASPAGNRTIFCPKPDPATKERKGKERRGKQNEGQ